LTVLPGGRHQAPIRHLWRVTDPPALTFQPSTAGGPDRRAAAFGPGTGSIAISTAGAAPGEQRDADVVIHHSGHPTDMRACGVERLVMTSAARSETRLLGRDARRVKEVEGASFEPSTIQPSGSAARDELQRGPQLPREAGGDRRDPAGRVNDRSDRTPGRYRTRPQRRSADGQRSRRAPGRVACLGV
jgi:hypothetical protein